MRRPRLRDGSSIAKTAFEATTVTSGSRTRSGLGGSSSLYVDLVAHEINVPLDRVNRHHPSALVTRVIQPVAARSHGDGGEILASALSLAVTSTAVAYLPAEKWPEPGRRLSCRARATASCRLPTRSLA